MTPRRLEERDLPQLPAFLDQAFAGTRDATRYTPDVVGFFARWMWNESPVALVLEDDSGLVAASLGALRAAHWNQETLRIVHLGPVAVRPDRQREGLGAELLAATTEIAHASQADLLTLTANASHGPHRLYAREGFQIAEAYRPLERPLTRGAPLLESSAALEVEEAAWSASPRPQPPRPGAIAEAVVRPAWTPPSLCPRWFLAPNAGVATVRWPIVTRGGGRERHLHATQIVARWGTGPGMIDAISAAEAAARTDGSACIYTLPSVAEVLPGFRRDLSPVIYRMAKPVSSRGENTLSQAAVWDECCPSP